MISKYHYLEYDIIKHFGKNLSSTNIARLVLPASQSDKVDSLRKHIDKMIANSTKHSEVTPYTRGNKDNILIIGDIHAPFNLESYLSFCRIQQEKFKCGRVIFIGDLIDNHYSSYHETDPDGLSAGD